MPIKLILLNNAELGKISKEQRAAELDVWKTSLTNPNFAEFARSCGALGFHVTERGKQLDEALEAAFGHNGPCGCRSSYRCWSDLKLTIPFKK